MLFDYEEGVQAPTPKVDELALDSPLLTETTQAVPSRMMPDATWARFAGNLDQKPRGPWQIVGHAWTREIGTSPSSKSHRVRRARQTLRGPRVDDRIVVTQVMKAYLAGSEDRRSAACRRAIGLGATRRRCSSSSTKFVEAGASKQHADRRWAEEGRDRYRRRSQAVRCRKAFARDILRSPRREGDDRARRHYAVGAMGRK